MADLNFFRNDKKPSNGSDTKNLNFNIIIADTQWETFETLTSIRENYNSINLSSEFAVNFILDYEKIDLVIISTKIGGLEEIRNKTKRKNIKIYVLGRDLKYPVDREEVLNIIENEFYQKINLSQHCSGSHQIKSLKKLFMSKLRKNTNSCKSENSILNNIGALERKNAVKNFLDKKATNINIEDNKSDDIDSRKTRQEGINCEEYDLKKNKDENEEPGKDHNTEAQFYNNFWKEVTAEASEKDFNNKKNETPQKNKHEYKESGAKPFKHDDNSSVNWDNENFLNSGLNDYSDYITDKNPKRNNYKPQDSKYLNPENKLIISRDMNNPDVSKHRGNLNVFGDKKSEPLSGKVITIKQKTLVFIKAKGGVGSTFLSLYLAYEFRNLKTLLIDLNFSEGGSDIGYYLGMPKTPNMIIFTDGYNRISMENSIISFKGHFDILQPPPSYDLTKKLDIQDIYSIVDVARKKYHLIIFDLPNQINDIFFGVLDMADLAIMVSDYTPGSINRLASINRRFIYNDMEKILVLNKNKNKVTHSFIKNNISEFFSLKEIVNIDDNAFLSGKSDFQGYDFSNNKDMQIFKDKVMESLTCN